ncbi:MAG: flavodoxin [Acutalibacteraceae bacterium]
MRAKRILALILSVLAITAIFVGCGKSGEGTATTQAAETVSGNGNHKVLVVYFSATGNTKAVAEIIAKTLNADTFELQPADPYTDSDIDYYNPASRVSREHNSTALQNQVKLKTTEVPNWDSYDVVFFGYPIWWGDAAWPVRSFLKNNDFTGKTVIPFCTSASSSLGDSAKNVANLAGSGNWTDGRRFQSGASSTEVASWARDELSHI